MGFGPAVLTKGFVLAATAGPLLASARAEADASTSSDQGWLVPLVGAAFVVAAYYARTTPATRVLLGAVGVAWLLPSFLPSTLVLHQGLLLVALVAFPFGTLRRLEWLVVPGAGLVAMAALPRPAVAAAFAFSSVWCLSRSQTRPRAWAAGFASALVALTVAALYVLTRDSVSYRPALGLDVYEFVLLGVAATLTASTFVRVSRRTAFANQLLADRRASGLPGLRIVLAELLRDPTLGIELTNGSTEGDLGDASPVAAPALVVTDGDRPIAVVRHHVNTLLDTTTADAVRDVVRLMVQKHERQRELDHRVVELEEARARVAHAADEERASSTARLHEDVVMPLRGTAMRVCGLAADAQNDDARTALFLAADEIAAAIHDIDHVVIGTSPAVLGDGRLGPALCALAGHATIPTRVDVDAAAPASESVESALFYVASESVANAHKHSQATGISIALRAVGTSLTLSVSDDGSGGADPQGSGLSGLGDRISGVGGRFTVDSPAGAGTVVTATVPIR